MRFNGKEFILNHQLDPEPPKAVDDPSKKVGKGQTLESRQESALKCAIKRLERSKDALNEEVARLQESRNALTKEVDVLREEVSTLQYQIKHLGNQKKSFS